MRAATEKVGVGIVRWQSAFFAAGLVLLLLASSLGGADPLSGSLTGPVSENPRGPHVSVGLSLSATPSSQFVNNSITFIANLTPPSGFGCGSYQPDFCFFNITMGNGAWANSGCSAANSFSYNYGGYPVSGVYYARATVQMFTNSMCSTYMGRGTSALLQENITYAIFPVTLVANVTSTSPTYPVTFTANLTTPAGLGCGVYQPDFCFFNITMGNGAWANSGCSAANSFSYTYGGYPVAGTYYAHATVQLFSDSMCTVRLGAGVGAPLCISASGPACTLAASVLVDPATGWNPLMASFNGSVSGGIAPYAYSWDFGDGSPASSAQNPVHSYTSSGSYTVTFTVADSSGTVLHTTTTVTVTLSQPVLSSFAATPDPVLVGSPTQLSVTAYGGAAPYSYSYTGLPPGCTSQDVATLSCTPTSYGTFQVTLTLTDARTQTVSRTLQMSVNPPQASVYPVTFAETGLASGTTWTVSMNGQTFASGTGTMSFVEPNGTYAYSVGAVSGYTPTPSAGSVTVNGASQTISLLFSAVPVTTYPISFAESGLPSGTTWSVTLAGSTQSATGSIAFTEPNGTYSYTVGSISGYVATPSSGTVAVSGSAVTVTIAFTAAPAQTYSVTFTESGLPAGTLWSVTMNSVSGTSSTASIIFSGQANGNYSYTVGAVSGYTANPSSGSVTVNGANVTVSIAFTPTSSPTYPVTFTESGLPVGMTWSVALGGSTQSATGSISFTEPNGTYSYTVGSISGYAATPSSGTVTVSGSAVAVAVTFTSRNGSLVISSFTASPNPVAINMATTLSVSAQGGTTPYSYSYSGLPPGCISSDTANLSCTPTSTGTYSVMLTVTDSSSPSQTATSSLILTVNSTNNPLTIQSFSASPATISLGGTTDLTVSVSGGTLPYSYVYSGLPSGCGSSNTPSLLCTPSTNGTYGGITVTVSDANGTHATSNPVSFTVTSPGAPTITSATVSPSTIPLGGLAYVNVSVSGGTVPYTYVFSGLPPGCASLSVPDLTCSPSQAGSYGISVSVTGANGQTVRSPVLSLTVQSPPGYPTISTFAASPAVVTLGNRTTLVVSATGGVAPFSYIYAGLPQGCATSDGSSLLCTPTATGQFTILVTVTDSQAHAVSATTPLTVLAAPPSPVKLTSIAITPNPAVVGTSLTLTVTASGGTPPLIFSYAGLPPGCLSRDTSNLACTPTQYGNYRVAVTVMDGDGATAQGSVNLTVDLAVGNPLVFRSFTVSPASLTEGGTTYFNVSVQGGTPPYTYSYSGLPPGCDSADHADIGCIPTAAGTYSVTVTVSDATRHSVSGSVTLSVQAPHNPAQGPGTSTGSGIATSTWVLGGVLAVALGTFVLLFWRRMRGPSRPTASP